MPLQEVHTGFTFGFDKGKLSLIQNGVKNATKNLQKVADKTDAFQRRMESFWGRAKAVLGVYLGGRAIRAITTDYAQAADATAKFAAGLGISAQEYQKLNYAAGLAGITTEELNMALPNLAKRAGDAADGSRAMALAFQRANVEIKDQHGKLKGPLQLLTELADGLKTVEDKQRKTQILMTLFGRAGKKMGVLLDQGADGIKKAMLQAEKLGIVLSDKDLKAAENFNDEMLRVKSVLLGIRNRIAAELLPVITKQLKAFQTWWREGRNAEHALKMLKTAAFLTSLVLARLVTTMVIKQAKEFVVWIKAIVTGLRGVNAAATVAALKITAIFAAIALVGLIIEDLVFFAQGKDSLIGRILGKTELADDLRDALVSLGKEAKKAWKEMKPALLDAWNALKGPLRELGQLVKPLLGPVFRAAIAGVIIGIRILTSAIEHMVAVVGLAKGAYDELKNAVAVITDDFGDLWDALKQIASIMGIDLPGAAGKLSAGWQAAISNIMKSLGILTGAISKVVDLKNMLFGKVGKSIGAGLDAAVMAAGRDEISPSGERVLPGLFQPRGIEAFRGGPVATAPRGIGASIGGLRSQVINTAVNAGAVQLTVNASGDPEQIARAVNNRVNRSIRKAVTAASRDIKPPPSGQS